MFTQQVHHPPERLTRHSSDSDTCADDESDDTDEGLEERGRPLGQHAIGTPKRIAKGLPVQNTASSTVHQRASSSGPSNARKGSPVKMHRRTFTRSRSPAINAGQNGFSFGQVAASGNSPSSLFSRQKIAPYNIRHVLPSFIHATFRPPFSSSKWRLTLDVRQALESCLLICSVGYCAAKMRGLLREQLPPDLWNARDKLSPEMWISIGRTATSMPLPFSRLTRCRTRPTHYCIYHLLLRDAHLLDQDISG